ncbi:carboxylating nicotinate-nucleotide diphosphorylase [Maricaulis parjimensis]|uniref:carboxylating nicotinate-nucleotide diphosphorylase n=1 Tax=Maricaulis parjimensis TaxID=144023 RepID=UPI00193A1FAA|nr:carboxylating nicotinate-nucleotide diphosphorylase [Maricaulis parjimensis]
MPVMPLPRHVVTEAVARAISEDQGGRGDVTSLACIPAHADAKFYFKSREAGVICGLQPALEAIWQCDPEALVSPQVEDGAAVKPDDILISVTGRARGLLSAERIALNFMGRMSGIASFTARYVEAVAGTNARIVHTRKTTPGFRAFELQAVQAGGGALHRYGLDDAILIKDNHVAVCGGVAEAVEAARNSAGHMTRIAVEVDRLDQLDAAIAAGAESILLDNFPLDDLRAAVAKAKGKVTLEASGGVNLDTVRGIAETGVDIISVGALTHSAPNFDIGLDEA